LTAQVAAEKADEDAHKKKKAKKEKKNKGDETVMTEAGDVTVDGEKKKSKKEKKDDVSQSSY
jgi:hypothetical protein